MNMKNSQAAVLIKKKQRKEYNYRNKNTRFWVWYGDNFKYLGIIINNKSDRNFEIDPRMKEEHKTYFKYKSTTKVKM